MAKLFEEPIIDVEGQAEEKSKKVKKPRKPLSEERKEQLINRKKRSKAGKLGAKIRWDKLQDDKL